MAPAAKPAGQRERDRGQVLGRGLGSRRHRAASGCARRETGVASRARYRRIPRRRDDSRCSRPSSTPRTTRCSRSMHSGRIVLWNRGAERLFGYAADRRLRWSRCRFCSRATSVARRDARRRGAGGRPGRPVGDDLRAPHRDARAGLAVVAPGRRRRRRARAARWRSRSDTTEQRLAQAAAGRVRGAAAGERGPRARRPLAVGRAHRHRAVERGVPPHPRGRSPRVRGHHRRAPRAHRPRGTVAGAGRAGTRRRHRSRPSTSTTRSSAATAPAGTCRPGPNPRSARPARWSGSAASAATSPTPDTIVSRGRRAAARARRGRGSGPASPPRSRTSASSRSV